MNENLEMREYYKDRLKAAQDFDAKVVFSWEKIETAKEEATEAFKEAEQQLNKMNTGVVKILPEFQRTEIKHIC